MPTYNDDIDYRLLSKRVHVAQKEYSCLECGAPIIPGDAYLVIVELIDNEFSATKRHYNDNICWINLMKNSNWGEGK